MSEQIVILSLPKNLNSFPPTGFRTRSEAVGKDFRPFGKLRATQLCLVEINRLQDESFMR